MPLKPEIRGLCLMATRCYKAHQYESALQYFTMALRRHVRMKIDRHHHHHNILSDPVVQILTLNSCAVLCQMKNFTDAFYLLHAILASSPDNPLQNIPQHLVPLTIKIIALFYLDGATSDTIVLAAKYLQLIRIYYQPLMALSSDETVIIFLTESILIYPFSAYESLAAFRAIFQNLSCNYYYDAKLVSKISSLLLRYGDERKDSICSLSKTEFEIIRTFMSAIDFACFLNIVGVSHVVTGRSLLAIEAFEKSYNLVNSNELGHATKSSHRLQRLCFYLDSCISSNLSVVYHMLDVMKNYQFHWQSLASDANSLLEGLNGDIKFPPIFWAIRYSSLFNISGHASLAGDYKAAYTGFSILYHQELNKLVEICGNVSPECGLDFVPGLYLELLEVIAMLLAAQDRLDESWKVFLICFDEVTKIANRICDPMSKQNFLASCYTRIVDKVDRCHPPSHTNNREFEEIRRLRLQLMTSDNNKGCQPSVNTNSHVNPTSPESSVNKVPSSIQQSSHDNDEKGVIIKSKKAFSGEVSSKQNDGKTKMRKKLRATTSSPHLIKDSPYISSDVNQHLRPAVSIPKLRRVMSTTSYSSSPLSADVRPLSSLRSSSSLQIRTNED